MKLIWKSKVSKHPLRDSLWFQNWQWWHENEGCDTAHYRVIWIHLGCFGLVQAFALFLARRAPTALASSLYSLGRREKRNKRPAGWVKSQWRNPVASKPYIKQLTHRQRNHCNAEKSGKLNPFNLASCQVWISYFHPMISKEWIGDHSEGHTFFFPAWLENGNESSPFCPFQIDHCTSVSNQTSASPKLRGVRHLGKSLGVLRKVYWRSCGGQIHSSNLSWTLVKIQLTSSSLRLVRLGRLLLFELQQDTNLLIRLNICILVAFIRWIKHKKYSKDTEEW